MNSAAGFLFGLALAGLVAFLAFVMPIVTFLKSRQLDKELGALQARVISLGEDLDRLRSTLTGLKIELVKVTAQPAAPAHTAAAAPVAPPLPLAPPRVEPVAVVAEPIAVPAAAVSAYAKAAGAPSPAAPAAVPELPRLVPSTEPAPTQPIPSPSPVEDTLETRIGGHLMLYVGVATVLWTIAYFIKYAFDNEWVNETARCVLGAVTGVAMVVGGRQFAKRGYNLYGEMIAGGGFVALYISVYAAFNFYGLISQPLAFALMVGVTAATALAADRQPSVGLAVVAVLGGFLTPFLVGSHQDAQVTLLTYDAVLVAGTIYMAQRRNWPALNLMAYVLVCLTFFGWAATFYSPEKYLTTELFLVVFCALFLYMQLAARRSTHDLAGTVVLVLWSAPFLFHLASINNLLAHSVSLLVYLTLSTLAVVLVSIKTDIAWPRLVIFLATVPVFLQWLSRHSQPGWRVGGLAVTLALYALHLVGQGERIARKADEPWPITDLVLFHLNGLALFAGTYVLVDAVAPTMTAWLALGLAAWHFGLAWYFGLFERDAGPNSLALGFALLGFAIGLQFDDWLAVVGWSAESVGVVWVAIRARRDWMRLGGVLLLAGTLIRLMTLGFFVAPAALSPVFNERFGVTLVIIAAAYGVAYLHWRARQQFDDGARPEIAMSIVAANALTVILVSTEISFYWQGRADTDATADLARQASLSIAWAIYGMALIMIGINRRYAPVRYLAIALLALTVGKVFLVDMSMLGGIYRIIGFGGLGVALLVGAWLYQRYRDLILGK